MAQWKNISPHTIFIPQHTIYSKSGTEHAGRLPGLEFVEFTALETVGEFAFTHPSLITIPDIGLPMSFPNMTAPFPRRFIPDGVMVLGSLRARSVLRKADKSDSNDSTCTSAGILFENEGAHKRRNGGKLKLKKDSVRERRERKETTAKQEESTGAR